LEGSSGFIINTSIQFNDADAIVVVFRKEQESTKKRNRQ
jgi:hypothetical protein